jgi:Tfp pilus assembly protein PilZ
MKNSDRVRELSFGYLDDSLSDREAKELENILRNDEDARRTFIKEVEFEVLLRMHFEEQFSGRKDGFTKSVMKRLHANDNRRSKSRFELRYPDVKVQYKRKTKALSLGVPCDVSESGVCFVGTNSVNEGDTVEVVLSFDEESKPFRKKGKVVWVEEEDDSTASDQRTWKIGCRFVPDEDWDFQSALSRHAEPPDSCPTCDLE